MALKFAIPSNIYHGAFLRNYQVSGFNPVTNQLTNYLTELVNMKGKFRHCYKILLQNSLQ